jgi:dTDP-4-dehydrorhamnose 3,5-epimerase
VDITIESQHLNGIVVIVPGIFRDDRGFLMEVYRRDQFISLGLPGDYVQEIHSRSAQGVLRGLHYQWDPPMGKLMRVTVGTAFLVAVDIRKGSPTLGKWFGIEVSAENRRQVWAPAGFARGFCVLSDAAEVQYKCTGLYNPGAESGLVWNDPTVGIDWPVKNPTVSKKDRDAQTLEDWLKRRESDRFRYEEPQRTF